VGLIVDTAREFRNFSKDSIRPLENSLTGINRKYVTGMIQTTGRLVLIPDLNAILNVDDVQLPPQTETQPALGALS
jgi:chemotaxis signal transduction protein